MSVLVLLRLAIAAIVFLMAWFNGPSVIRLWGRFERIYLERLHIALDAIYSRTDPKKFFYTHVSIMVVFFCLVSMAVGVFNGFVIALLIGLMPSAMLSRAQRKRRDKIEDQLPDALVSMANSLRAGLTLPQAMGILTDNTSPPISEEFALLLKEHRLGLTLDEAMTNMSERVASKNLDLVITSIQVARIAGGNLPQVFEDTSQAIREIGRLEAKISAMTAQGKMQAWVLGSLPIVMAFLIYKVDPKMISPLWEDPYGWGILFFVVVFEIVGVFFIRKILTVDV